MKIKAFIGIVISFVFVYLAFKDVSFQEMGTALATANYLWLIPAILAMLVSHMIRAVRWQAIMEPIQRCSVRPLFSALMIGYAANNLLPLRLGEFLRAYAVGKSQGVSKTSAFATVIVERLLDLMSLLLLLSATVFFFPLPENIKNWGYLFSGITLASVAFVLFVMEKTEATIRILGKLLPQRLFNIVERLMKSFLQGFVVFRRSEHYLLIFLTSIAIWFLYALVVYFAFFSFDFDTTYGVGFYASLVVLIIISVGITIPASPGFVGTYHWFCMLSLALFGVPESEALGFAIVSHAINILPFTAIGLVYFWKENLRLADAVSQKADGGDGAAPTSVGV